MAINATKDMPPVRACAGKALLDERFARLRASISRRLRHRRTIVQLSELSIRQREDVGIAGLDLNAVARRAIHHN